MANGMVVGPPPATLEEAAALSGMTFDPAALPGYAGLGPQEQAVVDRALQIMSQVVRGPRPGTYASAAGRDLASRVLDVYRDVYGGTEAYDPTWFRRWLPQGTRGWTPEALAAARSWFLGEQQLTGATEQDLLDQLAASLPEAVFRSSPRSPITERLATTAFQQALTQATEGLVYNPWTKQYEMSVRYAEPFISGVAAPTLTEIANPQALPTVQPTTAQPQYRLQIPEFTRSGAPMMNAGMAEVGAGAGIQAPPIDVPAPDMPALEGAIVPRSLAQQALTWLNTRGLGSGPQAESLAQAYDAVFEGLFELYQRNGRMLWQALSNPEFEQAFLEEAQKRGQGAIAWQMLQYLKSKAIGAARGY